VLIAAVACGRSIGFVDSPICRHFSRQTGIKAVCSGVNVIINYEVI
jgi:hypothetical protein